MNNNYLKKYFSKLNKCISNKENINLIKKTALEFGYPYHSFATFFEALSCHTRHLKQLGTA